MKNACPLKTSQDWVESEKTLGENNTYKLWMDSPTGDILPPLKGAFYMYIEEKAVEASDLLNKYIPLSKKAAFSDSPSVTEIIEAARPDMFADPRYLKWLSSKDLLDKLTDQKTTAPTEAPPKKTKMEELEEVMDPNTFVEPIDPIDLQNKIRSVQVAYSIAQTVEDLMPFQMVSSDEAETLLKGKQIRYYKQPVFYLNDKIYYVIDNIRFDTQLSDIILPFITAFRISSPTTFAKMYTDLANSQTGQSLIEAVKQKNPTMRDTKSVEFKQLVVEEAVKRDAKIRYLAEINQASTDTIDPITKNIVQEMIVYARKSLRTTFKGIERKDIFSNTTLDDISDVLSKAGYKVAEERLTSADIAKYNRTIQSGVDEILTAVKNDPTKSRLDSIIESFIKINSALLNKTNDPMFFEIKKKLSDESGRFLRDISEKLKRLRKENEGVYGVLDDSFKAKALVGSLFTLEKTLKAINGFMKTLDESGAKDIETLEKVAHYNYLLKGWKEFITSTEENLLKSGVKDDSFVYSLVSRLDSSIKNGENIFKNIQKKGAVKTTKELLRSFSTKIIADLDSQLVDLKKQPQSASRDKKINELENKRAKYDFTDETVEKLYRGELGDANFWSSMFESYTTNPDPIIASFALFLKGQTQDIINTVYTKSNNYMNKAKPFMNKLGMTNVNFESDWAPFLMKDTRPVWRDGKIVEEQVLAFQAPVKDYRTAVAKLNQNIKDASEANDKEGLKAALKAKELHLSKFFNRKYKKAYYDDQSILINENPEAFKMLEEINTEIEAFRNENPGDIEFFLKNSDLDSLYRKKAQLYSMYNEDGTMKDDEDVAIAKALKDHATRMRKYYKSVERPGAFQRAFESFADLAAQDPRFANIKVKYDSEGNVTEEFKEVLDQWLKQNSVLKYTDAFYNESSDVYEELAEVSKLLPENLRTDALFRERSDILVGFKDEYGQPNPDLMGAGRDRRMTRLKEIQEEIYKKREEAEDFFAENPELELRYQEAVKKASRLKYTEPTEYYLEQINKYMTYFKQPQLNEESAGRFLTSSLSIEKIDQLKAKNKAFAKWFDANHIKVPIDRKKGPKYKYERLVAWSVARINERPGGPKYYETTTVTLGKNTFTIQGLPTQKFFYTSIKDEHRTIPKDISEEKKNEEYVGKVINNKGEYLPLSIEQFKEQGREQEYLNSLTSTDPKVERLDKYINKDYYDLIKNDDKRKLLELTVKYHLNNQLGIDRDQKGYLDLPRYPIKTLLEKGQRGKLFDRWVDRIQSISKGIKATLQGKSREEINEASRQEEDIVEGFKNPDAEKEYEQISMLEDGLLNPVFDKMPIMGIQSLPIEQVSYDVISALNIYALQTEKQKVFNKVSPVAQAVLNTLEDVDAGIGKLNAIKGKMFSATDTAKHFTMDASGKNESVRAATFRAFYNREMKGVLYSEKHLDWLNKLTNSITGAASMNYFAANLPSAIKNYWGILWQLNVEAIAGEYVNFTSLRKGKVRSKIAMNQWTTRIWGGKHDTLDTQMIMRFDPIQGKAEEVMVRDASRTFQSDLASISWVYSPRKFMEMEGGLQLFYSMMYYETLERNVNGVTSLISYADAWELDKDGRMVLKSGIDPEWGITYNEDGTTKLGENFKKFQNKVHEKFKDLNGTFAKYEQPQAQMFFAYRLFAFMRRYFTSMFMNRFGKERANYALETIRTGYYVEAVQSLAKIIMSLGKHALELAPSERRALFKTLMDVIQIVAVSMIASMFFGWDDDDEDRFEKLRAKSGAIGEDDFRLDGWLSNHALTLLLKTQAENQSFIPLPGLGLNNYLDFTSSTSIAFGPTVTAGAKLITDISQHAFSNDDEKLYYTKDMGPYEWQKEGEAKMWTHLGNMVGFSGTQVDPVKGLQSWESFSKQ